MKIKTISWGHGSLWNISTYISSRFEISIAKLIITSKSYLKLDNVAPHPHTTLSYLD